MPNHVKNKIELIGDINDLDSMIKTFGTEVKASLSVTEDDGHLICNLKGEKWGFCWFDTKTARAWNRTDLDVIGLPVEYEPKIKQGFLCFPDFEKVIPPPNTDAYKDLPSQRIAESDPTWWRTWNIKNWGSKWSGYSYERPSINVFVFETAWSPVHKVIEAISKAYPKVTIKYSWADEDTGYNCGRAVYHDGLIEKNLPTGGSIEAYELAFELRSDRADNYELVNGRYQYKEEN